MSSFRPRVRAAALLGLLLALPGPADARLLDDRDTRRLADGAASALVKDDTIHRTVTLRLERSTRSAAEVDKLRSRILDRMARELREYALSLKGYSFPDMEAARGAIDQRVRLLRYNVLSDPLGYARGERASFVFTDAFAARLDAKLPAMCAEKEKVLADRLRALLRGRAIRQADIASIRALARERAFHRARKTIDEMRGARFWNAQEAQAYLEYAVGDVYGDIRGGDLADRKRFREFVTMARQKFPYGTPVAGPGPAGGAGTGR